MPSNIIYQYVWRDYSLPTHKSLVLTLKDNEAIAFLAMVTTIVAYTQSRSWVILHNIFNKLSANQVGFELPEKNLSQSQAIRQLSRIRFRSGNSLPLNQYRETSPWIAVVAIANIVLFVTLGIVLPWTLSGGMETPIVRSRETNSCIGMELGPEAARRNAELANSFYQRCWYDVPTNNTSCGRTDVVLSERPELLISQVDKCPFSGNSCKNGTTSFLLEHQNVVPRQYGLNIKQQVSMNHRLTCAPLETANFLTPAFDDRAFLSFMDNSMKPDKEGIAPAYSLLLRTLNGPNQYSKNLSGQKAAMEGRPTQLHVWPIRPDKPVNLIESSRRLDHRLRKEGGSVFVIGLQVGRSYYSSPIDDPFFSAHDPYHPRGEDREYYFPDYEITTIGCLEQHNFCLTKPSRFCTPWGSMANWDNIITINEKLLESGHSTLRADEWWPTYWQIMTRGTVENYLHDWRGIKASITFQRRGTELFEGIDKNEQWLVELKAWFETSFLAARYKLFNLLEPNIPPNNFSNELMVAKRELGNTCNKALFYSSDYTNIDFAKLLTTLSCLLMICLLSIRDILMPNIKFAALWSSNKLKNLFGQGYKLATKVQKRIALIPKPAIQMSRFGFPRRRAMRPLPRNYAQNSFWGPRSTRHMEIPVVPDVQPSDIGLQKLSVEGCVGNVS